ncbi:16S rRNA (guanine(527)-N(7))-methyltransferase RsmG [Candidatus Nitrotoga sp. 1052]|uniref:16S rRNA (guanine(527)-N(7))-methyltransferase RsmG n=1 Tax=Candidatus Nitrotoga sp. 1052 TaxID=2886964 RepID=UPI001EF5A396|nr:16S rRNA (guanine(527)-N(7))-methyltransferase RsmG [Candidatus Nitrotoga sp. 1052]CAH1076284.1 16S rRNA m(7)G527 methyltransferase [Candidatus Nitrotoga sp. 1052]
MNQAKELALGITQLGLDVVPEVQCKLLSYLELLQKWNRVYNLTAIRQPEQMVRSHLLDSLAVLPHLWPGRWLDVGCGAGLPGLILALMRPEWTFVLLDSNSKKTSFVRQVKVELGLRNVSICCARVETWQAEEKFDGIISRAFAETAKFVTLTRHLLDKEGRWVAMKGVSQQELERLPNDVRVERVIPLQVPGLAAARCLIMLKLT